MAQKILICYNFEKIDPSKRKQFDRELFGTNEKSHNGKYTTSIKGYLSNKKYRKPIKSTILIEKKYLQEVIQILKKYSANFEPFELSK